MKLWFKYCAGILFGLALYFVVPRNLRVPEGLFPQIADLVLRIGFYPLIPIIAINIPLAVLKLSEEKKVWSLIISSLRFNLISLILASSSGIILALVARPGRLPLLDAVYSSIPPSLPRPINGLFPHSFGEIMTSSQDFALPILFLSFIIGLAMAHDPAASRPVTQFLDSLSRIFYTIVTFITEIFGVLLIPLALVFVSELSSSASLQGYAEFFLFAFLGTVIILSLAVPIFIYIASGRKNPFPILYSMLPSLIAALVSGNLKFALGPMLRQQRESLGIKRRYGGLSLPLGLVFGRAGSAFLASYAFVVILYSYSPLIGSLPTLLSLLLIIPLATIFSSVLSQSDLIGTLAIASVLFGQGMENGYRIILPSAVALGYGSNLLDALWLELAQTFGSRKLVPIEQKSPAHFI
ncbi:MAG: transporter [Spirochaetes bacterium]|nr:MAG: transporter [Spirochaetota bacterium]